MKDKKHIQSFNEHQENLNISDVSDSYSCKDYKPRKDNEIADEYIDIVIKQLKDFKKGEYDRNSKYIGELVGNLMKIDVLFSRDIKKNN